MKTIEQLLAEIATIKIGGSDILVNNLFQSQSYSSGHRDWQANLRTASPDTSFFEFGRGATPAEALQAALEKARAAGVGKNDMPKFLGKAHVNVKQFSLEDML